jgi:hypothetical protein
LSGALLKKTLGDYLFKLHTVVEGIEGNAVSKNHNSILSGFELYPLIEKSCPGHNSKTIRDINMKL